MQDALARPDLVEGLRLVRLVGRGGEGEVWEAVDPHGRRRALKLVRPDCLAPPAEAAVRAAWLVRIEHPALVRVHRSGVLGAVVAGPPASRDGGFVPVRAASGSDLAGWGFVEMDLVEGESLVSAEADPQTDELLAPLAEALDLLHAGTWSDGVPLVHRDVKPANLMRGGDGQLVLVDPSTLRGLDAGEVTRVGTPVYCAPEVLTGRVTPAADVYSFAATFVALETGRRGAALAEVIDAPWRFALPRGVRHALAEDPTGRPASCRAVLDPTHVPTTRVPPPPAPATNGRVNTLPLPMPPTTREAPAPPVPAPAPVAWAPPAQPSVQRFPQPPPRAPQPAPTPPPLPAGTRRRRVLPWVAFGSAIWGVPAVAIALGTVPRADLVTVGAAALVAWLLMAELGGQSRMLALFVPPLAWARLLAERAAAWPRRQACARAVSLPGATLMVLAVPQAFRNPEDALASVVAGLLALLIGVQAVRATGTQGILLRILAVPLWAAGTVALLALGLLALLPSLLTGRAVRLVRGGGMLLASAVELANDPVPGSGR